MGEQVVVGYLGEIGVLEIIQEERIALLDGLFYVLIDNCIGLARTGRAQDHRRTEGIDKVDPSVIRPAPEPEAGAEVDGILVLLQLGLLHERFVLDVEHVFEQVGLQQAGHPQPRHEQADIPGGEGGDIQHGARRKRQRMKGSVRTIPRRHALSVRLSRGMVYIQRVLALSPFSTRRYLSKSVMISLVSSL